MKFSAPKNKVLIKFRFIAIFILSFTLFELKNANAERLTTAQQTTSVAVTDINVVKWGNNGAGEPPGFIDHAFKFLSTSVTSANRTDSDFADWGLLFSRRPNSLTNDNEARFPVQAGDYYYLALAKGSAEVEYRVYEIVKTRHNTIQGQLSSDAKYSSFLGAIGCGQTCGVRLVASVNRVADPNFENYRVNSGVMFIPGNPESVINCPYCKQKIDNNKTVTLAPDRATIDSGESVGVKITVEGYDTVESFISTHPRIVFFNEGQTNEIANVTDLDVSEFSVTGNTFIGNVSVNLVNDRLTTKTLGLLLVSDVGKASGPAVKVEPTKGCVKALVGSASKKINIEFMFNSAVTPELAGSIVKGLIDNGLSAIEPYKSNIEKFDVDYYILDSTKSNELDGLAMSRALIPDNPNSPCAVQDSKSFYIYVKPTAGVAENERSYINLQGGSAGALLEDNARVFIHELGHLMNLNDEYVEAAKKTFASNPSCRSETYDWRDLIDSYKPDIKGFADSLYKRLGYYTGKPVNCFSDGKAVSDCYFVSGVSESSVTMFQALSPETCTPDRHPGGSMLPGCMYWDATAGFTMCRNKSHSYPQGTEYLPEPCSNLVVPATPSMGVGGCGYSPYGISPTIGSLMRFQALWSAEDYVRAYGPVNERRICNYIGWTDGICAEYNK